MLLIDAVYINVGGGKVLLDYLIEELEKTDIAIFYLLDERVIANHPYIKKTNVILYLKGGLWDRFKFYLLNKIKFTKIFCLGNIPPTTLQNYEVITYFHNPMYLQVPADFNSNEKFKYLLKVLLIKFFKNSTSWWLQSDVMKQAFVDKYKVDQNIVSIIPFYPPFDNTFVAKPYRENHSYLYVSNATPNKNHIRLISAFCAFYDKNKLGKLTVTVNDDYPEVVKVINSKINEGYPIKNIGFIKRNDLKRLYLSHGFLIFPSLAESFGLGLVEAIENGCKVLAADLPYTYAVCEPSLVFNPFDEQAILNAFNETLVSNLKPSISKIDNKIDEIIDALIK